MNFNKNALIISIVWLFLIGGFFWWDYINLRKEERNVAIQTARSSLFFLPDTRADGAMRVAEKIRTKIEAMGIPHENSATAQVVTVSLGVATSQDHTDLSSYEELINQADKALYRAKHQGRNRVGVFHENNLD